MWASRRDLNFPPRQGPSQVPRRLFHRRTSTSSIWHQDELPPIPKQKAERCACIQLDIKELSLVGTRSNLNSPHSFFFIFTTLLVFLVRRTTIHIHGPPRFSFTFSASYRTRSKEPGTPRRVYLQHPIHHHHQPNTYFTFILLAPPSPALLELLDPTNQRGTSPLLPSTSSSPSSTSLLSTTSTTKTTTTDVVTTVTPYRAIYLDETT